MTKVIHVTMPNGSVWAVPAILVADPRARYYATHDTGATEGEAFDVVYAQELEETLSDPYELIDWAHNNMNWSDVSASAYPVKAPPQADYQEGWVNGEMEVVDA